MIFIKFLRLIINLFTNTITFIFIISLTCAFIVFLSYDSEKSLTLHFMAWIYLSCTFSIVSLLFLPIDIYQSYRIYKQFQHTSGRFWLFMSSALPERELIYKSIKNEKDSKQS